MSFRFSSRRRRGEYDVYLSCSDVDRFTDFVRQLYGELHRLGIRAYTSVRARNFSSLFAADAFRGTKFAIVVISKSYASSLACLEELLAIIGHYQKGFLIPIFYDVDPVDLRKLKGPFYQAFQMAKLKPTSREPVRKEALTGVSDIPGVFSRHWTDNRELILSISSYILDQLKYSTLPADVCAHLNELERLLSVGLGDEVRMIGICGMEGTGKTTLARYIYEKFASEFESSCFIDNVKIIDKHHGLAFLRKQVCGKIFEQRVRRLAGRPKGFNVIKEMPGGLELSSSAKGSDVKKERPGDLELSSSAKGSNVKKERPGDSELSSSAEGSNVIKEKSGDFDLAGSAKRFGTRLVGIEDQFLDLSSSAKGSNVIKERSGDLDLAGSAKRCSTQVERMEDRKVLVVLDDVDKLDQLKAVAGNVGPGSRIIVTTSEKDLLLLALPMFEVKVYEIKPLNDDKTKKLYLKSTAPESSSSYPPQKNDVFLSFCGQDTYRSFISHLYRELGRLGIKAIKDDKKLESSKHISNEYVEAIKDSKIAIAIFSKHYAVSPLCLEELAVINECNLEGHLIFIPIFYDVKPLDVRKQKGHFSEAFQRHEMKNLESVGRWKEALNRMASFPGWDPKNWTDDSEMIQSILGHILDRLDSTLRPNDCRDLVGMEAHMKAMEPLLSVESHNEVRMTGICGMGGIGKTTLARYIYERFSCQFTASCFIDNVKDIDKNKGLMHLQQHFLSKILQQEDLDLPSHLDGCDVIKARLEDLKVLVVLDDIDRRAQLDALAKTSDWFCPGSRIIITSRQRNLPSNFQIYEVKPLNDDDAIQLFSQFAFGREAPEDDFLELSLRFIEYAHGLPLALKIYGSFLKGKSKEEWEAAEDKLGSSLHRDIMEVLRVSYDELDFGAGALERLIA